MFDNLKKDLEIARNSKRAKILARFFKTGKGEYGEGDIFLGITVPVSRSLAIKYRNLTFREVRELLKSKIHEERLIALLILVHNFKNGSEQEKKKIFDFYLSRTKYINNWDLVDLSADKIVGEFLARGLPHVASDAQLLQVDKSKPLSRSSLSERKHIKSKGRSKSNSGLALNSLASGQVPRLLLSLTESKNLWERRIAIIATFAFIKRGECGLTFKIAGILLSDRNDLIQKAVGWMLREVGKRCGREIEEQFLVRNYKKMGRTALRYAIEHFPADRRKTYLLGKA